MDVVDERLAAIREYRDKWYWLTEYDTWQEMEYGMEHKTCIERVNYLLRQLDYAEEVLQTLREADELPPAVQYALDVYRRRTSR